MGKTKTALISDLTDEKLTGKAAYEAKKRAQDAKKKADEGKSKTQVAKVGLKGGERIKVIEAEPIPVTETVDSTQTKTAVGPRVHGKKYKDAKSKVDKSKLYNLDEAIKLVKNSSYSKFDGTVELHINVKKENLSVNVELPNSTGKAKKIEVADDKTILKLKKGKVDFDILLATADMMPKLVPFAKLLGPKGLMPNPKNGTLIKTAGDAKKFSGNTVNLKTEKKAPLMHIAVGKVSQKETELTENVKAIITAVGRNMIVKAHISPTMGPSVKLQI
jgi:large subunit ribosomal protein L1